MEKKCQEIEAETGEKASWTPSGGSNAMGCFGYIDMVVRVIFIFFFAGTDILCRKSFVLMASVPSLTLL